MRISIPSKCHHFQADSGRTCAFNPKSGTCCCHNKPPHQVNINGKKNPSSEWPCNNNLSPRSVFPVHPWQSNECWNFIPNTGRKSTKNPLKHVNATPCLQSLLNPFFHAGIPWVIMPSGNDKTHSTFVRIGKSIPFLRDEWLTDG